MKLQPINGRILLKPLAAKEFGGTEIKIEGENYILLTEDDLLAKYEAVDKIPE